MTALEFVERERARLRRLHVVAGVSLALAITFTVLALGVLLLGNSRSRLGKTFGISCVGSEPPEGSVCSA